jgi:hypothetical protein
MVVGHLKNKHSHSVASHESDELAKTFIEDKKKSGFLHPEAL